ncbi:MAG: hypothetical protein K8U03_16295 [Planctomycetia bacterium]|nr:hypothetical protein [Planctomycetia bacterium]
MPLLPFRTGNTWLSDDLLIVLDRLFNIGCGLRFLKRETFQLQWNLDYSHGFDDEELERQLGSLCDQGLLLRDDEDRAYGAIYRMLPKGGALWSEERRPVWERYCQCRWTSTMRGREVLTVVAVSARIRDDILRVYPRSPTRTRTKVLTEYPYFLGWLPFDRLYLGAAICDAEMPSPEGSAEEFAAYSKRISDNYARLDAERTWWDDVADLQRFITPGSG